MNVWMHTDEINAIERNLNPSDCVFEWGAGGSTIHFGKQVSQYISVERPRLGEVAVTKCLIEIQKFK